MTIVLGNGKAVTSVQMAYLAGIIDGEGSLSLFRRTRSNGTPKFDARLQVISTDRRLLDWIVSTTSLGRIWFRASTSQQRARWKPMHAWALHANGLRLLLPHVVPHLVIKSEQAHLLLRYTQLVRDRVPIHPAVLPEVMSICDTIYLLNTRGLHDAVARS